MGCTLGGGSRQIFMRMMPCWGLLILRDVLTKYLSIVVVVMAKHFESAVTSASESLGSFGVLKTRDVCFFLLFRLIIQKRLAALLCTASSLLARPSFTQFHAANALQQRSYWLAVRVFFTALEMVRTLHILNLNVLLVLEVMLIMWVRQVNLLLKVTPRYLTPLSSKYFSVVLLQWRWVWPMMPWESQELPSHVVDLKVKSSNKLERVWRTSCKSWCFGLYCIPLCLSVVYS